MVMCYVMSGMLGVIGLETLANVINFVMGLALVLLCTWAYVRYSGEHREIGGNIDSLAELIWDNVSVNSTVFSFRKLVLVCPNTTMIKNIVYAPAYFG